MLALLSWALEADVSALLGGDAPPRSRENLRRAVWFALALLGAAPEARPMYESVVAALNRQEN